MHFSGKLTITKLINCLKAIYARALNDKKYRDAIYAIEKISKLEEIKSELRKQKRTLAQNAQNNLSSNNSDSNSTSGSNSNSNTLDQNNTCDFISTHAPPFLRDNNISENIQAEITATEMDLENLKIIIHQLQNSDTPSAHNNHKTDPNPNFDLNKNQDSDPDLNTH